MMKYLIFIVSILLGTDSCYGFQWGNFSAQGTFTKRRWGRGDFSKESIFKRQYAFHANKKHATNILRIPKIIHQIWLGSPFPEKYKKLQQSWIDKHPDWQYILWTDEDIKNLKLRNKKQYDQAKNYGQKSDIARYEILYRFGGLYIDTDFECLESFEPLHSMFDFYTGIIHSANVCLANGLLASVPGHPIVKNCIDDIHKLTKFSGNTGAIMRQTGPFLFTKHVLHYMISHKNFRAIAFPPTYFYPIPNNVKGVQNLAKKNQWIKPESMAVHYWECSWIH